MATIIPTTTKNTIATCIQIHVGDMRSPYRAAPGALRVPRPPMGLAGAAPATWRTVLSR